MNLAEKELGVCDLTVERARDKFKKLICMCKQACLQQKTKSGLKRFLDEQPLGFQRYTIG